MVSSFSISGHVGTHLPLNHFVSTIPMLVSEIVILPVLKCRPSQLCMLTKLSHPLTFRATEDANSACARKLHKNGGQSGNRLLVLLVRGEFLVSDDKSCMAVSTTKHVQSTQETMV